MNLTAEQINAAPAIARFWSIWNWIFVLGPRYGGPAVRVGGAFGLSLSVPDLERREDVRVDLLWRNRWRGVSFRLAQLWSHFGAVRPDRRGWGPGA